MYPFMMPGQNPNQNQFSTMPVKPDFLKSGFNSFAKGGQVLPQIAEIMRQLGQGNDTVLAHIHPLEARELKRKHGYSGRNPMTGLPQYGKRHGLRKMVHAITHGSKHNVLGKIQNAVARPIAHPKKALPTIGSALGFVLGGPGGAALGGTLGGALSGRKDATGRNNIFKNAMKGLGTGAIAGLGGNMLGSGIGGSFGGTPGIAPGGTSAIPGSGLGGITASIKDAVSGILPGDSGNIPGLDSIGGALKKLGITPLQALLGGTALYGMAKGKKKAPAPVDNQAIRNQIPDFMRPRPPRERRRIAMLERRYVPPPEGYIAGEHPEHEYFEPVYDYEDDNNYSQGGLVAGDHGGQSDTLHTRVPEDSFIIDASTLSDLGDGNTLAGNKRLDDYLMSLPRMPRKYEGGGRLMPIQISSGERTLYPDEVAAIGNGSNAKGAQKLTRMVKKVRKQKRTSGEHLPPRAARIRAYMGGKK